jgi:hypothetical protein
MKATIAENMNKNITDNEVYNTKSRPSAFRTRFILQIAEVENVFATIATDKINKNLKGIKIKTNITKDGWSANVIDKKDKIQIKIFPSQRANVKFRPIICKTIKYIDQ